MIQPWVSLLVSAVTGAILTILYNWWNVRQAAKAKEKGAIAALAGELRRSNLLCDHNANLRQDSTAPLIRFPMTVALDVTFVERHSYPRLASLQKDMEAYTMGIIHINQLIDLHHMLWASPERPSGVSKGAEGRREELRFKIADLCSGKTRLEGVGTENFIFLPTFIDVLLKKISRVIQ